MVAAKATEGLESCSTCSTQQARAGKWQAPRDRPALIWPVQGKLAHLGGGGAGGGDLKHQKA